MSIAVVTNCAPPYRVPLFKLLSERLDATFYFHGPDQSQVPQNGLPFPSHFLSSQSKIWHSLSNSSHKAVIGGLSGRIALPLAYASSRHTHKPFILWASLWAHPRTPFHALSSIPVRRIYRKAEAVVTYGSHVSAYVARRRGDGAGIFEATQAVDNDFFSRRIEAGEREELRQVLGLETQPIVLFVGRLVEEKGLHYLLQAWKSMEHAHGEVLVVAGEGPLAAEVENQPNTKLIGQQSRDRLPVIYSMASALVLPSIMTRDFLEPWGLVLNEAMNQGVPVIASKSVGAVASGLVRDGHNGLVVSERSVSDLAGALGNLLDDDQLRSKLGTQARSDVSTYTYEQMADGFVRAVDYACNE